jgi:hypothetical protein
MPSKRIDERLAALERHERQRSSDAIDWALVQLSGEEFDRFVAFWQREQVRPGIYPEPGAEAAAVERYCELAELAYVQGLTPNSRRV